MNSITSDLIFSNVNESLRRVENAETFKEAHRTIKEAVGKADSIKKEGCFGLKFVKEISPDNYEKFLLALKIKARDATGIVPSIDSCALKESQPMGFRRIIKIGASEGVQRVWEEQNETGLKIIFATEGLKFLATNEITKRKDGKVTFIARYIVDAHPNPKYKTAAWFLDNVMNPTFKNLNELVASKNLNERFEKIVRGQENRCVKLTTKINASFLGKIVMQIKNVVAHPFVKFAVIGMACYAADCALRSSGLQKI